MLACITSFSEQREMGATKAKLLTFDNFFAVIIKINAPVV
jgi:hypothetical protein